MLLSCLSRAVLIVESYADFGKLSGSQNSYLAGSINLSMESPVTFENGFLDCVGHQISSSTRVFDAVSGAMIRNCTFRLATQFATTIDGTTLTNVTVVTSESGGCQTAITNSEFHGVKIETNSQFAANVSDTLFVGCSLGILVEQSDRNYSFIGNMTNCTVQNCFLNASIAVNKSVSVSSLTHTALDLLISKSRFVSKIISFGDYSGMNAASYLTGCVAEVHNMLTITECDFLSSMLVSGKYGKIAGVLSYAFQDANLTISNLSSYLSVFDDAETGGVFGESLSVGNVVSYTVANQTKMENIAAFSNYSLKEEISYTQAIGSVYVSGLISCLLFSATYLTNCFAFGSIYISVRHAQQYAIAGCVAYRESFPAAILAAKNISFSGSIYLSQSLTLSAYYCILGGIFGKIADCQINNSQFYGNITLDMYSATIICVGAVLSLNNSNVLVDSCSAIANTTINSQENSYNATIGCIAGSSGPIYNSFGSCDISISLGSNNTKYTSIGMLVGVANGNLQNCSVEGAILLSAINGANITGIVGGLVGSAKYVSVISNLFFRGKITVPESFATVASAFGSIGTSTVSSVVVAVDIYGAVAPAYVSDWYKPKISNLFVDCNKRGNAQQSGICRSDLTTNSTLPMLGAAFAWSAAYNGRYPYPNMLPVLDASKKYVLPEFGGFSADSYFVDDAGFPFPKVDFQPCRGVCYGTYSSPVIRTCDGAFEYCVDIDRAIMEFPDDSCIAGNAVCGSGISFCSSEAELFLLESESEYACQKACPGCYNGYCSQAKCVCNVYNAGDTCTPKCDADQPICFGGGDLVCDFSNAKCIPTPSCDNMTCVHGKCVAVPIAHCECDNLWEGDDCGVCRGFGKDCTMTQAQCDKAVCHSNGACEGAPGASSCSCRDGLDPATACEKCKGAMEVINGTCVCGQAGVVCEDSYFCSSGSCQKNCMHLDKNCTSCSQNQLDLCGSCQKGLVLKNGLCITPKKVSAAAIAGGVVGGCVGIAAVGLAVFSVLKSKKPRNGMTSKDDARSGTRKDQNMKKIHIAVDDQNQPLGAQQQAYTVGVGDVNGSTESP